MIKRFGISWRSLRFRLIGWYVLLLVLTLTVFSFYIFFQFRDLQQAQQDINLQAALAKVNALVEGGQGGRGGDLRLRPPSPNQAVNQNLNLGNIQARLYNRSGTLVESIGSFAAELPEYKPNTSGFATLDTENSGQWRVYSQVIVGRDNQRVGWLVVGQPIVSVDTEVSKLFAPILFGAVLAFFLALLGGLFLANRALLPIDRVTRTAQTISTQDLTKRINYHGPEDEIGRLAKTLDRMLDRLEKGFDQERRFTSDASHELRTPLTALKGRIEVTLSRLRTVEEYQETLTDLKQEVDRLVRLANSLLYLARLDQAESFGRWETLNLSELLESLLDSLQWLAETKAIELSGEIAPTVKIYGSFDQLSRLFLNLVENALKYTPQGGRVLVRLQLVEKKVLVTVTDNGTGIAPEHLPNLFKRFYRVEADRASVSGGAGLGLAIAYEIARQHNGTIEVESNLGIGSTFKVILPV
jgi:heavy metal sensor kinase